MSDTAVATREPKAALVTGGDVAAIVPRNIEEAFRLAGAIYASGMAPATLKTSEQVMIAIMAGAELGFAPFQAVQAFAIINNRPNIWGDAIPALLWSNGFIIEEWWDDDDNATKAFCKITRPVSGAVTERTFSIADAKKANLLGKAGPWQTNQKRMLQMRARAFCARDGASDVLKGFQIREEVEDYSHVRDVTAQPTGMRARLEARTPVGGFDADQISREIDSALGGDHIPDHDAVTGEITEDQTLSTADEGGGGANNLAADAGPETDMFPGDRPAADAFDVIAWAAKLLRSLPDYAGVDEMREDWNAHKDELKAKSPELFKELNRAIADRAAEIGWAQ